MLLFYALGGSREISQVYELFKGIFDGWRRDENIQKYFLDF